MQGRKRIYWQDSAAGESLVTQMWAMSFFDYSEEYRKNIGMVDNLVRLALGLEDVDDLIFDLKQALDKI
jgi:cystathionine beta-lyase/cystathionine gamma-synthase